MSWKDRRSYCFDVNDKRFERAQKLYAKGQAEKALSLITELRTERNAGRETGRVYVNEGGRTR